MTKNELIKAVALDVNITQKETEKIVDSLIDIIVKTIASGDKVKIAGFGTFEPKERKARNGVNPKTGEKIMIGERKVPVFSANKAFKDIVNK